MRSILCSNLHQYMSPRGSEDQKRMLRLWMSAVSNPKVRVGGGWDRPWRKGSKVEVLKP